MHTVSPNKVDILITSMDDRWVLEYVEFFDPPCPEAISNTVALLRQHDINAVGTEDAITINKTGTKDEIGKLLVSEFMGWCNTTRDGVLAAVSNLISPNNNGSDQNTIRDRPRAAPAPIPR